MGVLLTAGAIFISTGIGIWAERRWPEGAANAARKALVVLLYVLLPPVIFFNLAAARHRPRPRARARPRPGRRDDRHGARLAGLPVAC